MSLSVQYTDLQAKHVFCWLVAIECGFALAFVVIHILLPGLSWGPLGPLFDLDREVSLPTWFSVIQLCAVSALLFIAAKNNRQTEYLSNSAVIIAGMIFLWLSADEGAQLHERIEYMARYFGQDWILYGGRWGAFIAVYLVLGLLGMALGAKHLIALWRHFKSVANIGLLGAAVYIIGAAGFEIMSFPLRDSNATLTLKLITVVFEEFLEMLGITIILYATLILADRLSMTRDAQSVK